MTTPTRPTTRRPRTPRRLRVATRALRLAVSATAVGGVLLVGSPVLTQQAASPAGRVPAVAATPGDLGLVAAHPHRWSGHPGRTVVRHRVRRGDTVTALAVRFHAWTRELRAINHLGRHGRLYVGRTIRIPVVDAAVHHHRKKAEPHHRARHHPKATKHRKHQKHHRKAKPWRGTHASRSQVRRVIVRAARHHHVEPELALAIAWQESGWQQRRVSSAGAIGTMQVLPGTGRWMSTYVDRRLNIYGLRDNVTAGVVLVKVLRSQTTWKRSIASYYQGLGSVRQRGLYPSTKRYTRSVMALHRRLHRGWDPTRTG